MKNAIENFLNGPNADFISDLYEKYQRDSSSVTEDWRSFFASLGDNGGISTFARVGTEAGGRSITVPSVAAAAQVIQMPRPGNKVDHEAATSDSLRALMLIRAYRVRGHLLAHLDPLGLEKPDYHPELDPRTYGFTENDYERPIFIDNVLGMKYATLSQILDKLRVTYCQKVGIEYMHIQDPDQRAWIQERFEKECMSEAITNPMRKKILQCLVEAEYFEKFLSVKYPGAKRFGLEGGESTIAALEAILAQYACLGVKTVNMGMAHRGRLSVLANIMKQPKRMMFLQFQGGSVVPDSVQGSGDVKYHLGYSTDRKFETPDGVVSMHVSLSANPSHLEAVNPIVLGKVRAKQDLIKDTEHSKITSILMHGDAAFAGQGLVAETLELTRLPGYRTGGTLHLIINNQIGFTTSPPHSRSSPYSSDIAKAIQSPIFHVNGDDPEAVVWVAQIAAEFREKFKHDVVLDLVCYRRHGHNETDEPAFTQPLMYRAIRSHPTTQSLYRQKILDNAILTSAQVNAIDDEVNAHLRLEFDEAANHKPEKADWLEGSWTGINTVEDQSEFAHHEEPHIRETGVSNDVLQAIGIASTIVPDSFNLNSKIARQFEAKRHAFETNGEIDWATAESLAFATLAIEGNPIRLSGQDSGRGTFSQRHMVLIDQETEQKYIPINHLAQDQARIEVVDSPLAEASVLGFEYGYTQADPHALVMWEAQFGDFSNGAQVIIDQFVSSGEVKWLRFSGLVMLLPHGMEGQGPEHSSARLERYLQLCAEKNMQIVNCTTPANYFHVLRRQLRRDSRKPLVIMTPKSLLRHKMCVSSLNDMQTGTCFQKVIGDSIVTSSQARRVVICSGKIYYDLLQEREHHDIQNVAIIRLEQYYPFPLTKLKEVLAPYAECEMIWCQEEPMNMGAWTFVDRRIEEALLQMDARYKRPIYIGRPPAASPATGILSRHMEEQKSVLSQALMLG